MLGLCEVLFYYCDSRVILSLVIKNVCIVLSVAMRINNRGQRLTCVIQ